MAQGRLRARVPASAKVGVKRVVLSAAALWGDRRTLPDFIVVGAQRAGTTSLYHYLVRHPDVAGATLTKEVHFFDTNHIRGDRWYRAFFPTEGARKRHRRRTGRPLVAGEATPYYLFHPLAPDRAHELVPEARLIVMLRDPVERAYSHFRHEVELGYEHLPFEEALEREPERLAGEVERMRADPGYVSFEHQHHSYVARGRYAEQLKAWLDRYRRERVLVVVSEEFFADPREQMRRVHEFLGLRRFELATYPTWNATPSSKIAPGTRSRLAGQLDPSSFRLANLLGRELPWSP